MPNFFATIGIPQFFSYVNDFKETFHDSNSVEILGIIINGMDRNHNNEAHTAIEQVRKALERHDTSVKLFTQRISKFKVFEKTLWQAKPVRKVSGRGTGAKSKAAEELIKLRNEIIAAIEEKE
jgi:cellulose biosynthesis protein BcsQ